MEEKKQPVRVCCKRIEFGVAACNTCAWFMTAHDITHVEIGFKRMCKKDCPYRTLKGQHQPGTYHWVYYTAAMPQGVIRAVSRSHVDKIGMWQAIDIMVPNENATLMEEFFLYELGKPYDDWRMYTLPVRKFWAFETPLNNVETQPIIHPPDRQYRQRSRDKWICSELVANALCVAGIFPGKERTDVMTPGDIYDLIKLKFQHAKPGTQASTVLRFDYHNS